MAETQHIGSSKSHFRQDICEKKTRRERKKSKSNKENENDTMSGGGGVKRRSFFSFLLLRFLNFAALYRVQSTD